MSRARSRAWQNGVRSLLSGGDVKVKMYTPGDVVLQTTVPEAPFSAEGEARIGTVKRGWVAILEVVTRCVY